MAARGGDGRTGVPVRVLFVVALIAIVSGPVYAMLAGTLGAGVFVFAAGVVLLGVGTLLGGRDRPLGWVLVSVGGLTAAADVARMVLVG